MGLPLSPEDLKKLKTFVDLCSANVQILNLPQLSFVKEFVEKLGGKVPEGEFKFPGACPFGGGAAKPDAPKEDEPKKDEPVDEEMESEPESELELDMDGSDSDSDWEDITSDELDLKTNILIPKKFMDFVALLKSLKAPKATACINEQEESDYEEVDEVVLVPDLMKTTTSTARFLVRSLKCKICRKFMIQYISIQPNNITIIPTQDPLVAIAKNMIYFRKYWNEFSYRSNALEYMEQFYSALVNFINHHCKVNSCKAKGSRCNIYKKSY